MLVLIPSANKGTTPLLATPSFKGKGDEHPLQAKWTSAALALRSPTPKARSAEAHDFILELPNGYETVVGERGQKLSGGQRQRLSLARAILRDPAILVLDEATSAVDNETEAAIQRSLAKVTKGRTSVVIAHRLSTVRDAHRIWVLEAGRVVEAGTHNELIEAQGLYAALWRVQTGVVATT